MHFHYIKLGKNLFCYLLRFGYLSLIIHLYGDTDHCITAIILGELLRREQKSRSRLRWPFAAFHL